MIETKITCGCCAGTGKYTPLTGPVEPCGTCKGEGVVDKVESVPNPAPFGNGPTPGNHESRMGDYRGRVEIPPVQYAQQLTRMLELNPPMTVSEVADKMGQSATWVAQRLSLTKLEPMVAAAVDQGQVPLANAYMLAKMPPEEQRKALHTASVLPPSEFGIAVNAYLKRVKKLDYYYGAARSQNQDDPTMLSELDDRYQRELAALSLGAGESRVVRVNRADYAAMSNPRLGEPWPRNALIPELRQALDEGRLTDGCAMLASRLTESDQLANYNNLMAVSLLLQPLQRLAERRKSEQFATAYGGNVDALKQNANFAIKYGANDRVPDLLANGSPHPEGYRPNYQNLKRMNDQPLRGTAANVVIIDEVPSDSEIKELVAKKRDALERLMTESNESLAS